jgi:5-methylcytosine-specific restriction endonuclease McrA
MTGTYLRTAKEKERLRKMIIVIGKNTRFKKGHIRGIGKHLSVRTEFKSGHLCSENVRLKISNSLKGLLAGKKHPNWKGGKPKCMDCNKQLKSIYAKRCSSCFGKFNTGENHPFYGKRNWDCPTFRGKFSKTKEYRKVQKNKRRLAGKINIEVVKLVYEDNIKKYGVLTCYLCELPIKTVKDNLEHKIPLCRGGTHEYNNLAIACQKCNYKKGKRTDEEYRNVTKTNN